MKKFTFFMAALLMTGAVYAQNDCVANTRDMAPAIPVISQEGFKKSDPTRAILYNNGPLITHPGAGAGGAHVSMVNTPYSDIYGSNCNKAAGYSLADDFILDAQSTVETINFWAYQTGSPGTASTITGAYVRIWNGEPGMCGSTVIWGDLTTNRMAFSSYSNINRIMSSDGMSNTARRIMDVGVTVNTVLDPGYYWLEWTFTGSTDFTGPWCPPVTVLGVPETGNAKQCYNGVWKSVSAEQGGTHDMTFVLSGTTTGVTKIIPKAPTAFTATPVGTTSVCNLQWTNPSQAFGGATLANITKVVLERDAQIIKEFPAPAVGGVMTFTDTPPTIGVYDYSVYAVTTDGNGQRSFARASVGNPCSAEVIVSGLGDLKDAWSWVLYDNKTGHKYKGAGGESDLEALTAGTFPVEIYGNATFKIWQHGTYGDNTGLVTVKLDGNIVYEKTTAAFPVGFNESADLPCAGTCESVSGVSSEYSADNKQVIITWNPPATLTPTHYVIYKNDVEIPQAITKTEYEDDVSSLEYGAYTFKYCVLPVYAASICVGEVEKVCDEISFTVVGIKNYTTTFSINPNPASNYISITSKNNFNGIEVLNFLGQVVISKTNNNNNIKLDISDLTNGIYFVRIFSEIGTSVQKFVKQ